MDIQNLPLAGYLASNKDGSTNPRWTTNKDKYISKPLSRNIYGIFNYFILDLDTKHAKDKSLPDNLENLLAYLTNLGVNTNTFMVISKTGGAHLYYNQLPFAYANPTGWLKTDYGSIDIRGYSTWVFGPNCDITKWKPDTWKYAIAKDIPPIDFSPMTMVEALKIDTTITTLKKNADYFLAMDIIPEGDRDNAVFQILSKWYKQGKTWSEALVAFDSLAIENKDNLGFDIEDKWNYVKSRETHDGREDKLVMAKRDWYYLKLTDEIFSCVTREAYSRTTFEYGIDNIYEYEVDGTVETANLTKLWLSYKEKKVAHTTGWRPDEAKTFLDSSGYLNLVNTFQPLKFEPCASAVAREFVERHKAIVHNVFMGDDDSIQLYYNSIRYQIECPLSPRTWSLTIISTKGTGKGTLWKTLARMLPGYGGGGISPDVQLLNKEFNEFLFEKSTILFDEVDTQKTSMFTGVRQGALKRYISENEHARTPKGKPTEPFSRPTYFSVEIHANSTNGMTLEQNDRRHLLVHCTSKSLNEIYNKDWLIEYYQMIDDDNMISGLMAHILAIPYHKDWDPTHPYTTKWHGDLCIAAKSSMAADILDALNSDNIYAKSDIHTPGTIRSMLITIKEYPHTLTSGKCSRAINELLSDGAFKLVSANAHMSVSLDDTGTEIRLTATRTSSKLLAVRHADKYITTKDARAAFFSHLPQVT